MNFEQKRGILNKSSNLVRNSYSLKNLFLGWGFSGWSPLYTPPPKKSYPKNIFVGPAPPKREGSYVISSVSPSVSLSVPKVLILPTIRFF